MSGLRIISSFTAAVVLAIAAMTPLSAQPRRGDDPVVFFRQQNLPQIVFQYSDTAYCHLQSEEQLQRHGAIGPFRRLPVRTPRGQFTGICPWPNGIYRRGDDPIVYWLRGRFEVVADATACRVADATRLDRMGGERLVRVVAADADLLHGRQDIGICAD